MAGQFEKLAKELNEAMTADPTATAGTSSLPPAKPDSTNFQDRIKATMDRMKSSNAEVDAGLADADSDDFLAEMLKSMGGTGEGGEEDFSTMLVNMMEQLTSKEILYEPMKELYEKYPEWIKKNEATEKKEDMDRYKEQFAIVKEIVLKFDEPNYKDEDESCREYIVERMQKMQTAGAPPAELMGDVGQGLDPPDVPSDCGVQ
ncbi:Pex19 protein [Sphaerosporella brunnea]|uniref:Pex19 protein n=1 Tax=Sphaerosporella brunnea TaxID=1250544 RepID=A0A5J5F308_9PEZI|nr:Pex19 protein [Sphaerosporella brunnea]